MEETIKQLALENAIKFKGKANPKALIGALISKYPKAKENMKETIKKIGQVVEEINSKTIDEQKKLLIKTNPEYFQRQEEKKQERKEERKTLPPLPKAEEGKVKTRIPPGPSKYNHLGHALSFLINYMYAKKYKGKCVMRFEDTNPDIDRQEYVDAMNEDVLNYLEIKPNEIIHVSDRIEKYYSMAENLIKEEKAYTCTCKQEDIKKKRWNLEECTCRNKTKEENQKAWKEMKKGNYSEGEIILRLKIDMKHKNAVMRDPAIFRICKTKHYRQKNKYNVWPLYDFENAIEEGLCKITHVLRSNEFHMRIELQDYIRKILNLPEVITKEYGRFNITGATTKGREIKELIDSGKYLGWDDPRLVTLRALKRRGIVKETYYELAKIVGMSKTQTNIDYSVVASINRKILDEEAKRLFLIEEPIKIIVENIPTSIKEFNLSFHPRTKKLERRLTNEKEILIEKKDYEKTKKGELIRLMDAINIKQINEKTFKYVSEKYEEYKNNKEKGPIIHFIPKNDVIKAEVMTSEAKIKEVIIEKNIEKLKKNEIIQFERWGFCKIDEMKKVPRLWFTHT